VQGDASPQAGARGVPAPFPSFSQATAGGTKEVAEELLEKKDASDETPHVKS